MSIPLTGVHLVGGVACNNYFRDMLEVTCQKNGKSLLTCPKEICLDNGAMIAWNAWEVKNAEQDVDIRNEFVKGHLKVPLGNFRIDQ